MHDDHMPHRFPWYRLAFGAISILVLIGTFGGFMWLLRTYVDPPRVASSTSPAVTAAALLASVSNSASSTPSEPRVLMATRDDPQTLSSGRSDMAPASGPAFGERPDRMPPPPNSGTPLPSWAGAPLPGAQPAFRTATSPPIAGPPATADAGTVSFEGPVPLPRPKPRVVVRVQMPNPSAAPLPRSRPPA